MKDQELEHHLRALPEAIQPDRDLWPDIEKAISSDTSGRTTAEPARVYFLRAAAAAAVVVCVALAAAWLFGQRTATTRWSVGPYTTGPADGRSFVVGERVQTDASTRLLATTDIGEVLVEPNTTIELREANDDRQVLSMQHGQIYARIVAPPRVFVVETPSVTAIDLGCEYRLDLDSTGTGILDVVSGWVALEHSGREWFVPAGASAAFDGDRGPAAPVFSDAEPGFTQAASRYREALIVNDADAATSALEQLLRSARSFDSLTLWHLAIDAPASHRSRFADAFDATGVLPEGFDKSRFVEQQPAAMDWLRLHLEETAWFRPDLFFGQDESTLPLNKRKRIKPARPGRISE